MQRNNDTVIAHHEAGHAVMAMACDLKILKMTIKPNGSSEGQVEWQIPDLTDLSRQQSVLTFVSGMTADFIHWNKWGKGKDNDAPGGCSNDEAKASWHLSNLGESDLLDAYVLKSRLFLEREDVWSMVELVAKLLLHVESVDGQAFIAGIAAQCPKFGTDDWDDLKALKRNLRANLRR